MEIEKIIDEIVNNMDKSLSKNEQIRYIYISLGKILNKNVDFYFSHAKKLKSKNYSSKELEAIYNQTEYTTEVICKSCSEILKKALDKINVNSKILKTISKTHFEDKTGSFDGYHHFIACEGENNEIYFLTLSADLGNIKMGYQTQHFANNISYFDEFGNQVYEGPEIKNQVLSLNQLKKMDEKIKYLDTYYLTTKKNNKDFSLDYKNRELELMKKAYESNFDQYKLHLVETYDNPFYKKAQRVKFKNGHTDELCNLKKDEIKKINLPYWKKKLAILVNKKIIKESKGKISDTKEQRYNNLLKHNNINVWLDEISEEISCLDQTENFNPIILINRLKKLFLEMEKDDLNVRAISKNIDLISLQFIDSNSINTKSKNLTNYYIAKKFITEMPIILDSGYKTYFSNLNYGEQADTIYTILGNLYPEITKENIGNIENYDTSIPPVRNKIITSAIKNKQTNEYSFVFNIRGNIDDDEYTFIYDPKNNKIFQKNLFDINQEYIIISSKLNPSIDIIENIDDKNPIKK